MEFEEMLDELAGRMADGHLIKATISGPRRKSEGLQRIRLKPVELRGELYIQFEYQYERILKHENVPAAGIREELDRRLRDFRQMQASFTGEDVQIMLSKKLKVAWKSKQTGNQAAADLSHDRKKQYLLEEGKPYPFLVRLGVQTPDGKVKKGKMDKFRQINRFTEFIADSLHHLPKDRTIRILDFGSGKSYLTFALYHYLKIEQGLDVQVTGLDLKKEVIEECRQIAADLGYGDSLEFLVGDINDYNEETRVDMVVTLHACDVATDAALGRAVRWGAEVILSVPCCQHELFGQLDAPELGVMLQHGLIKERFAALATDSIRAELLGLAGYDAQILEFIDMEHTPKNIMIRAYRTGRKPGADRILRYKQFRDLLGAEPFLERELNSLLDW
ncbi:class I SAM-dependent methyltransferase [Bhargavaea cecembensis]|uniref:class I SAM-dependent methyltransferase n=1 Tax=Bhargavaea cecembensis TaxID=394098 RepID=UPI00058B646F|nr:SAM-dependent methyltransferase [Bhargavaea cecembensis]